MTRLDFWPGVALTYGQIGSPFLPSDEDARSLEDAVEAHAAGAPARVLLLGATPRLADIPWRGGATLVAVDSSRDFVRYLWPGDIPGRRRAVQADWRALPLPDATYDVAIGDGSLNCVRYPDGIRTVAAAVRRTLTATGLLALRVYVRPDACESPEALVQDAAAGRIETFHQFRFRLLMAMQPSAREGVAVRDVYRYWKDVEQRAVAFPGTAGWDRTTFETIEPYRDSPVVHTFLTLDEWRTVLSDLFDQTAVQPASYVLGDRCPVIVWRVRR